MPNGFQHLLDLLLSFSADFIAFIVLTVAVMLFALYFGRDRLSPLIAGLYAALALYTAFPYTLSLLSGPYMKIGLYLVFAVLGFITFSGLSYFTAAHSGGFLTELIVAILIAGFLLAISTHVLPVQDIYTFTPATKALFASDQAFFWWLFAPLAGLFFIGR
ncbi:hypothetical protein HY090_00210 [Candidatus Kaiserbacteria bacterium]|nr:hypothetical protein [Candidatus Kaiserbacteria bacterium]